MAGRKHDKPFICMDIDLPGHPKLSRCRDPRACLGLWAAMTAYSREHLLSGKVPKRVALAFWADPTNGDHLVDMVRVGLLGEQDDDYVVKKYAPRNQTRAMVMQAREKARVRMQNVRANKSRTNDEQTGDVLTSTSISDQDQSGRESGIGSTGLALLPPADIPVTPAIRMRCVEAGAREPTRADVLACLENARSKGHIRPDWDAYLVSWMIRGRRFDRMNGSAPQEPTDSPARRKIAPLPPKEPPHA